MARHSFPEDDIVMSLSNERHGGVDINPTDHPELVSSIHSKRGLKSSNVSAHSIIREKIVDISFRFSTTWAFILSIYSTIFSTFWFLVAVIKPHWGPFVSNNGSLSPSTASTLAAGFAKTIEMSFITVFVVCLGQYLTFTAKEKGIRTSDLQLKTLMLLPGAIFTQKGSVRALWRRGAIGLGCVIAYLAAVFYTTASDALVSPRPSLANSIFMKLQNQVQTSMANPVYISQTCPNPSGTDTTANNCIVTEHAGAAMHNYIQYLLKWQSSLGAPKIFDEFNRPPPTGLWGGDLPIQGLWMPSNSSAELTTKYGRLIDTSLMAMPHAGVISAASLDDNNLSKLTSKRDSDQFTIEATAIAPVVNVTCAVIQEDELLPIIYSNWTHTTPILEPDQYLLTGKNSTWRRNTTKFDDVFNFHTPGRDRPVFYSLPTANQTMLDGDGTYRDMLYILFNSTLQPSSSYTLCGLSLTLSNGCTTLLSTNITGSRLQLTCSPTNPLSFTDKPTLSTTPQDWINTANQWALAIALGGGTTNSVTALASMLCQLAPQNSTRDPTRPSLTESLAILSTNTLLSSTHRAPFDGIWPFNTSLAPDGILPTPVLQPFQARVQVSDYSSGAARTWENVFLLVLLAVVVLNGVCLSYLAVLVCGGWKIVRGGGWKRVPARGLREDIVELHELFAVAVRSSLRRSNGSVEGDEDENENAVWRFQDGLFVKVDGQDEDDTFNKAWRICE